MLTIAKTIEEVNAFLKEHRSGQAGIGFVPTMGALHQGHISLIERAKAENKMVVSSIFVNPAQFNDKVDLLNYPRTPEADYNMLKKAGCDLLFEPSEAEIYPTQTNFEMDFGELERAMEGKFRPGHFKGVAKVVSRLFEIVAPNQAYFGEKDFQQFAVIREMVKRMGLEVNIVGCPTLRDERGLALSSRNVHLTEEEFTLAPFIYETLEMAWFTIREFGVGQARFQLWNSLERHTPFKVQYLEFVDSQTLKPILQLDSNRGQRACMAVLASKTRLIDNIAL